MKKLLSAAILSISIMGCSSQKNFENSGKCIICGKNTVIKSIGYCEKHYTLEKEHILRGIGASH